MALSILGSMHGITDLKNSAALVMRILFMENVHTSTKLHLGRWTSGSVPVYNRIHQNNRKGSP